MDDSRLEIQRYVSEIRYYLGELPEGNVKKYYSDLLDIYIRLNQAYGPCRHDELKSLLKDVKEAWTATRKKDSGQSTGAKQ